jgi:hypothetical protein
MLILLPGSCADPPLPPRHNPHKGIGTYTRSLSFSAAADVLMIPQPDLPSPTSDLPPVG